jgi:hypothetical protein
MAGRIPGMSGRRPRAGLVVLAGRSLETPGLDDDHMKVSAVAIGLWNSPSPVCNAYSGIKRHEREPDHSSFSSTEFKISISVLLHTMKLDSAVGIVTGYWLEEREGSESHCVENFLFFTSSRSALRPTQPPVQWMLGALSSEINRPWREADYLPPFNAKVKKVELYLHSPIRQFGVGLNYAWGKFSLFVLITS